MARSSEPSLPTLIIFKGGKVAKQFTGVHKKADFKTALDTALAGAR